MRCVDLAKIFNHAHATPVNFSRVCIDSRQVEPGDLFIAIVGETFDGHDYISQAIARGAVAVVGTRMPPDLHVPQFVVQDSVQALASLASAHRDTLHCPVIAVTGSNGKTTVKEMIAQILPSPSFSTPGNLNNHLGVPLSLLQCQAHHQYAVFELGANHIGEIAYTAALVKPSVALINNIAPAHLEGFGRIEGVVRAKGEIYQALNADGVAVINDDDHYAHAWDPDVAQKQVVRFSTQRPTTIHANAIHIDEKGCAIFTLVTPQGEHRLSLRVPGMHHVHNALAATACCYAAGVPLTHVLQGLSEFSGVSGRMTERVGLHGARILDDTYNANVRSTLTALEVLAPCAGQRVFVFGDMGELGALSEDHHAQVGLKARALGIDVLMSCGRLSAATSQAFGPGAQHYATQEELLAALLPQLNEKTTILVKGSRSAGMERVVRQLI